MDITLLPPTHILSNHSHLALLPSALPKHCHPSSSRHSTSSKSIMMHPYTPKPPKDGSSPFTTLPTEIQLLILSHLDLSDLLTLLRVSRSFYSLGLSPTLHRKLSLNNIPSIIPHILGNHILPSVRELSINLFPFPRSYNGYHPNYLGMLLSQNIKRGNTKYHRQRNSHLGMVKYESVIGPIMKHVKFDQLRILNIPFSSSYLPMYELESILENISSNIEKLDLRGSSLSGDKWIELLGWEKFGNLKELDLGFTNIHSLPLPSSNCYTNLRYISLSSCTSLSVETISGLFRDLPISLEKLDLSRLDQIPFQTLFDMKVIHEDSTGVLTPTGLREIKLVGIDHLTRRDIRTLKNWWEKQRRDCLSNTSHRERGKERKLSLESQLVDWTHSRTEIETPELISRSSTSSASSSAYSTASEEDIIDTPSTSYSSREYSGSDVRSNRKIMLPSQHNFLQSLSFDSNSAISDNQSIPQRKISTIPRAKKKIGSQGDHEVDIISINIIHSAILESEDEDGYRQFIGEVVGGTLDVGNEIQPRGYIEIDQ
ncbi:hypothetical protein L486_03807 [Kwoniella mangroviensis CBS 10435]|uniref:F-box domain-containing protein n=1 Tax=Kwoniella mangroviensis CBS 10435 TaxID=1331196 RepID=A0A1B9IV57_9TREE|nr:hypothetical protein L486_03807 [Kwoniella mangroviensis CBS 10435]